jgi:hypothetical protein
MFVFTQNDSHTQAYKNLIFLQHFSAASFSSLSTALSTASLAILIMSNASFMAGSASGLYDTDGVESLAATKNMLVSSKAKNKLQN